MKNVKIKSLADGQISFDHSGESQGFKIGDDNIFFRIEDALISVAHSEDGDCYSHTSEYIEFSTIEDAEYFLKRAQAEQGCPFGWDR